MIQLNFAPKYKAKEIKEPLHAFPYLLMEAAPIEKGQISKFRLEGEGVRELFNFTPRDNKLSYGQPEGDLTTFYLINTSSFDHDKEIKVNLDLTFNSKKLYTRLVEQLNLDTSNSHCFKLELEMEDSFKDLPTVKLILLTKPRAEQLDHQMPEFDNISDAPDNLA